MKPHHHTLCKVLWRNFYIKCNLLYLENHVVLVLPRALVCVQLEFKDTFTTHPKDCTLESSLRVNWPRLEGVVKVVHLLGEVKRIMYTSRPTSGWYNRANRGRQDVISGEILPYVILAVLHHCTEV